jgi:cytochrome c oxidase assembly protein subunit 15
MVYHRGLHSFAVLTACATFVLLIVGALVTSNDAGLSVPDWPLSYGSLTPPMVDGIVYEHTHRMVASLVGLLTIILAVWLWRSETRRWVRRLGLLALGAVIVQGLLGGLTVLLSLPPIVSIFHASLAQFFFCMTVTIAVVTAPTWHEGTAPLRRYLLPLVTTVVLYIQVILGATLRHAGTIHGNKGAEFVYPAFIAHIIGAFVVTVVVIWLGVHLASPSRPIGSLLPAFGLLSLLVLQLLLGIASYLVRLRAVEGVPRMTVGVFFTASHLAAGAALLATSLIVTLHESQESGVRSQKSGVRSQKSGVRSQELGVRS